MKPVLAHISTRSTRIESENGALAGITVVDVSRVLAGPLCSQMLADHGASVIKVEPPAGDETRGWGPPFGGDGTSAYFGALNRNKRNISIDLSSLSGQEVLARMLEGADVLVDNFKSGTMERWGLSDDRIAELFPRLVHCRITGFGTEGPLGGLPGYDAALQAYSGLMSINGEPDGPPLRIGVPVVDLMTGQYAFSGTLLALRARERTGVGQLVDCSLLDSSISLLHPHSANWLFSGAAPRRTGSAHPNIAPYEVFTTGSVPVFIGAANDRAFRALAVELGIDAVADDPRFATNSSRVQHAKELRAELAESIGEREAEELAESLLGRGVSASPVNDIPAALQSAQVAHREMVIDHGGYKTIGLPIKLSRTPGSIRSAPRGRGADSRELLKELGYDDDACERLLNEGTVDEA